MLALPIWQQWTVSDLTAATVEGFPLETFELKRISPQCDLHSANGRPVSQ